MTHGISRRFRPVVGALAVILLLFAVRAPASAERHTSPGTFDIDRDRLPLASLDGVWRFHAGDDPNFANVKLDDSSWALVRSDQTWDEQHLPITSGTFWYRTKVVVPADSPPLSVYIPGLDVSYQVFCNGHLLGGIGEMPPHPRITGGINRVFALPCIRYGQVQPNALHTDAAQTVPFEQSRTIVIAVRGWRWRDDPPDPLDGLRPGIRIGAPSLIEQIALLRARTAFWRTSSSLFLTLVGSLATLSAIGLYLLRRQEKEYLWYGLVSLLSAVKQANLTWTASHAFDWPTFVLRSDLIQEAFALALMIFLYRLLGGRRDWFFWTAVLSVFADFIVTIADMVPWMISPYWLMADTALFNGLHAALFLAFTAWVLIFIGRHASLGRVEARLLLPAAALEAICSLSDFILTVLGERLAWAREGVMAGYVHTSIWPIPFSVQNVADLLMLLSMLAVLIYRFTRARLNEETYEREREAARTVQQILIPQALPEVPGFQIASVYKPFGEVGGDFFQILPIEIGPHRGSVVIVIGDVSGKGLPAAMTVSLLVGTVRTLAHYTQSPAEILSAMNQRMQGRSGGGFTTCLVLRADPDGKLIMANAGHIPPYLNGVELSLESGLPLGIMHSVTYLQSPHHLAHNEQLTLMTDGVIEARAKSGELFGFERTQSVSRESVESVARAAQHFGQDDDITVLSICRT